MIKDNLNNDDEFGNEPEPEESTFGIDFKNDNRAKLILSPP